MIADILHYLPCPGQVMRKLAVFYVFSQDITEDPPEILMAGEREEAPGVGQHADEPRK